MHDALLAFSPEDATLFTKGILFGGVQGCTPEIPALWEADAGGKRTGDVAPEAAHILTGIYLECLYRKNDRSA